MVKIEQTAILIGKLNFSPARPSGIKIVSAASGPYPAELNASSPKTEIPANEPMRSSLSSSDERGRPRIKSSIAIGGCYGWIGSCILIVRRDGTKEELCDDPAVMVCACCGHQLHFSPLEIDLEGQSTVKPEACAQSYLGEVPRLRLWLDLGAPFWCFPLRAKPLRLS